MVAQYQVGARIDRGVGNRRLVGADRLGNEAQSPVYGHYHHVSLPLRLSDVLLERRDVFLVWHRNDRGWCAGLKLFRREVRVCAERRDAGLALAGRLAVAQHRAVSEERDLDAILLDDGGPACFLLVAAATDDELAFPAKEI